MPVIHKVGPDSVSDFDARTQYDWVVYWYQQGDYDGSGIALAKYRNEKKFDFGSLGHCSCCGPMEEWPTQTLNEAELIRLLVSDENLPRLRSPADSDFSMWSAARLKIFEISGWSQEKLIKIAYFLPASDLLELFKQMPGLAPPPPNYSLFGKMGGRIVEP